MKKICYIICIVVDLLAIGIVPLNLFVLSIPEYISIIISVILIFLSVMIWIQKQSKMIGKIVMSICNLIIIPAILFATYCNPYWNSICLKENQNFYSSDYDHVLSYSEAKEDYEYAMKYLKKIHPALLNGTPKVIKEQCAQVEENLKHYEKIDVCTLNREIESIFSLLSDAHTYVKGIYPEPHFLKYIEQHNQNNDWLVKINGMDIEDIFEQQKELFSYEDKSAGIIACYNYINSLEGLTYLGIPVDNKVEYTYETEDGKLEIYEFSKEDFVTYAEYVVFNHLENTKQNNSNSFVRYQIDEEKKLAILTLDACNYNNEYKKCLKEMFTEIKEKGIKNVAVDLRNNGGGYSTVANEFFRYLNIDSYKQWGDTLRLGCFTFKNKACEVTNKKYKDLVFDGDLYVLTSADTFSAATDFAEYVKDNHMGTIIGQASSNSPTGYNNITKFALPNSKIYMSISMKKCDRIDQDSKELLIEPDISCKAYEAIDRLYEVIGQR